MGIRVGPLGLLLVLALGTVTVAQSPSPSSPSAELHRVEVPEAGLAIGHPDEWVAMVDMEAVNESVTLVMTLTSLGRGNCGLVEFKHPGAPSTVDFIEDELIPAMWFAQPDFPGGYTAARLTFSVGQVLRVSFDEVREDLDGAEFHNVNHYYPAPDGAVALLCSAPSELGLAPEADWTAMARSLEFLPESVSGSFSPSRPLSDGRIERPGDGFAVVFPVGWEVTDLPAVFSQGPEAEEEGGRGRVRFVLMADDPYTDAICALIDFTEVATASPPWASVDAAVAARRAELTEEPGVGAPATTFIDLPAGRAGRLDVTRGSQDSSRWYFSDGAAWFSLSCTSSEPPDDRWLSIAETFEFLPTKPTPSAMDG